MPLLKSLTALAAVAFLAACAQTAQVADPGFVDEDLQPAPSVPKDTGAAAASAVSPLASVAVAAAKDDDDLRTHFLNVGAGLCTITECSGSDNPSPIIYDCGSSGGSDEDMDETAAASYIDGILTANDDTAPIVVVSHTDTDHNNWIPTVMEDRTAESIWLGGNRTSYPLDFQDWLDEQQNDGVAINSDFPAGWHNDGDPVAGLACGDGDSYVLTVNSGSNPNDRSLVLEITNDDFNVTLTGDATGVTQNAAMDNFDDVLTSILLGSHHGADSSGSNSTEWADATQPDGVVFSAGTRYYHPRCNAVTPYEPYVLDADGHDLQCGNSGSWAPAETVTQALYNTEDNGVVTVTGTEDNVITVECSRSMTCDIDGDDMTDTDAISDLAPANDNAIAAPPRVAAAPGS
jgi:beta-lactamase superfamily II metal-dependent hydrolase